MSTPEELKAQIDRMTYQQLLERNRFAPLGDPMFLGEVGDHFMKTMAAKRAEVGDAAHTAASKNIGL